MKNKCTVGFLTSLSGRWPRELPEKRLEEYGNWLNDNIKGINISKYKKIVSNADELGEAIDQFKVASVDVIVMLLGAFTGDDVSASLAEELDVPIILWAPYEAPYDREDRLYANAMCAATMNSASLKRLHKTCHVVYGSKEDTVASEKLKHLLEAYRVIRGLKGSMLGLFGYRPTAFFNCAFDESLIRRTFGVRIEETDLKVIFDRMAAISEEKTNKDMEKVSGMFDTHGLPEGHLENHSRLYFAMQEVIKEQGYDYSTIKCWPEMGNLKTTPCAVMGRLADEGIHIVCEGDVDVALALMVQNILTGKPSFITDMIDINEEENYLTYWHCGNPALSLFDETDGVTINNHPLAGQGTAFYGSLKQGKVTVARFCNIDGKYKLFLMRGNAVATKRQTKGAMVNVRINKPVRETLEYIIDEGVPHHYSIVWADVYNEMKLTAKLLGIEVLEVE